MNIYAESSAVLSWLLGDEKAAQVRRVLESAELVFASDLTIVECDRVLIRGAHTGRFSESDTNDRAALLARAAAHWNLLKLEDEILERARRALPVEPVRTLDALHISSALLARRASPQIALLTLDERIRECGRRLGFTLQPR